MKSQIVKEGSIKSVEKETHRVVKKKLVFALSFFFCLSRMIYVIFSYWRLASWVFGLINPWKLQFGMTHHVMTFWRTAETF
jgi:hypothetical protein